MIGTRVTITYHSIVRLGQLDRVTGTIASLKDGKVRLRSVTGYPSTATISIDPETITACVGAR